MSAQMTASSQRLQRPSGCSCSPRLAAPPAAAALLPLRRRSTAAPQRRQQPTRAAMMEVAQLAGEAGTAYDGSVWVTAASSVGLVLASVGMAALGATLLAQRIASGAFTVPDIGSNTSSSAAAPGQPQRRVVQPLPRAGEEPAGGAQPGGDDAK